ncbi:MAG TPA: sigma-70 family RNA polymerase sigma factor [Symbiobacteriaceae bacterium]|nr:sigma-70 family RNA polymerase sigma factor [Symbiobacteriaceae bacterium]
MPALAPLLTPAPRLRPVFTVVASAGSNLLPRITPRQLVLVRLHDEAARESLVQEWMPVVEAEARRHARQGGPADDLQAEGALALWEAALQYDPQRHRTAPERYIHNHIHRRVRRAYREAMGFDRPLHLLPDTGAPDRRFEAAERAMDLHRAMESLKPVERDHLTHYLRLTLAGLGPDEAARTLARRHGESFAATKKRMARIRRKLREKVAP